MTVSRELLQEAEEAFGTCNWAAGLPVPAFFEMRAMGHEVATGEPVTFLSGFWYDGWKQAHEAEVRVNDCTQIWTLGANSARWYR